ncbi:MAG: hypothetical protein FD165_66 [Gammaproteobacteria bacterium]|nr:MAG: hypothetical protein FD165_66 [Gammaproteobacteria bacterium]TND06644.1 MAG: hypothetical protein FD120_376 [Gammaproteobacteria bacterium]
MPVLAVCGHSGSGKTTLIEWVIPELVRRRLRVAAVKHDVHAIQIDRPGKDSDRLFTAGADVYLRGSSEHLVRRHHRDSAEFDVELRDIRRSYDVVLVEGFKHSPWPKVWLLGAGERLPPADVAAVLDIYPRDADRAARFLALIDDQLPRQWRQTPVYGGILIGGASRRMGRPKHLLRAADASWIEQIAAVAGDAVERLVVVGSGELPPGLTGITRLPDAADCDGPLAGMLAARRWAPDAGWLFMACDMPDISRAAIDWLLSQRAPGRWAVLPRLSGQDRIEPLFAYYDPRIATVLEDMAGSRRFGFQHLLANQACLCPRVPESLVPAWRNVNTPDDLALAR